MPEDATERPNGKARPAPEAAEARGAATPPAPSDAGPTVRQRPALKVKPLGSRGETPPAGVGLKAGSLFSAAGGRPNDVSEEAGPGPAKRIVLRPPEARSARILATYGPAPADQRAEREQVAAFGAAPGERCVSAGFILGVALIAVSMLGGIFIARLSRKVGELQQRVARLEASGPRAAVLP